MCASKGPQPLLQGIDIDEYNISDMDDEIRVEALCVDLLRHLYQDLSQKQQLEPEQAGACCRGADYFLREFIIAERCENLFRIEPEQIRQFAGHWYITKTPEPNLVELKEILNGTSEFYRFLARQKRIRDDVAEEITRQCREFDYYQKRIDDFWAIEDGGFDAWRKACPL